MKQRIFKFLADLRFAITILLIIACFSIIGTVIEQDQSMLLKYHVDVNFSEQYNLLNGYKFQQM